MDIANAHAGARIVLDLPLAPSVNTLWAMNSARPGGKDRRPSPLYSAWQLEAWNELRAINPKPRIEGQYRLRFCWPEKDRADVDARIKAATDLLVKHGVTDDDRLCVHVSAERSPDVLPGRMRVEIEEWTS
jgi:Holliday junction resolvase RusA-like endonuclease